MLLERALVFTLIMHGLSMVSMAVLLLPGLPGGTSANDAARVAYISNHAFLWRLGWLPWQVTAASNLLLSMAMVRTAWIPRPLSWLALAFGVIAVGFEQPGEYWWVTRGIELAQQAVAAANCQAYLSAEAAVFARVSAWAPIFYTVSAVLWSFCFAKANTWNRFLTRLSLILWTIMFAVSIAPILPPTIRPRPEIVSAGNALGFILLMVWFVVVTELVLRRSRPFTVWGRYAPWRYHRGGLIGRFFDLLANSRLLHELGSYLPQTVLVSDITDVVYVNYLVDAKLLEPLVPWGLQLQRLGADKEQALFTFLTYKHGHFGPRLGTWRQFFPSPVQSNWRIHVFEPGTDRQGIHFLTTAISTVLGAIVARTLSDGIAMHVPAECHVRRDQKGTVDLLLEPGSGSAPDVRASLTAVADRVLPASWRECFETYDEMLTYCVRQDRALTSQPWNKKIVRQEIDLGIPINVCQPLEGCVDSKFARSIVGGAEPLCFFVPKVNFIFLRTDCQAIP